MRPRLLAPSHRPRSYTSARNGSAIDDHPRAAASGMALDVFPAVGCGPDLLAAVGRSARGMVEESERGGAPEPIAAEGRAVVCVMRTRCAIRYPDARTRRVAAPAAKLSQPVWTG